MFKRAKVVMLSTNIKATDRPFTVGITLCNDGKLRIGNPVGTSETRQHLYITSDEEIKEGDWCYSEGINFIFQALAFPLSAKDTKKIIATTDTSLNHQWNNDKTTMIQGYIPQPSQQFIEKYIEKYNKGNVITDVLVEYEEVKIIVNPIINEGFNYSFIEQLKVNPKDNTITIKKVKDSWNRDELYEIINQFSKDLFIYISKKEINGLPPLEYNYSLNWINKNL